MDRQSLSQKIFEVAHLTGEFKLRSGLISHEYFDKYQFEGRPELLAAVAEQMEPLIPKDTEVLAGLEMGGIPIATALSLRTGLPMVMVRKEAKDYGTCQLAEGFQVEGKKILVIEDVITTGGQVKISTQQLQERGALITDVLCVIYRGEQPAAEVFDDLTLSPLFTRKDFPS